MPPGRLDAFVPPAPTGRRAAALAQLAAAVVALSPGSRVVVAIDGVDGAGKTVLARELVSLVGAGREAHRVSVDGFHRPAAQRCARGRTAETFYRDQYDHDVIRHRLVEPFRAGQPWVRVVHAVEREVSVPRGNARFGEVDATAADPASEVNARYVGGQRLYLDEVDPASRATWVLDNTDLAAPALTTRGPRGRPRGVRAPGG